MFHGSCERVDHEMTEFLTKHHAIIIVLACLVAVRSISTLGTRFTLKTRSREKKIADGFLKLRAGLPQVSSVFGFGINGFL